MLSFSHKKYNPYIGKESMNSKTNYMEVLTMNKIKKMKYEMNKVWGTVKPYAKSFCEGFFTGSGAAVWFYVALFGLYGLITKQKMDVKWVPKK